MARSRSSTCSRRRRIDDCLRAATTAVLCARARQVSGARSARKILASPAHRIAPQERYAAPRVHRILQRMRNRLPDDAVRNVRGPAHHASKRLMNTVGRGAPRFSQPRRKIARALMMARRLVDPARIGPETEIPDVQHIVEANSKRHLERKHVPDRAGPLHRGCRRRRR